MTIPSSASNANVVPTGYNKDLRVLVAGGAAVPVVGFDPTTNMLSAASVTALKTSGLPPLTTVTGLTRDAYPKTAKSLADAFAGSADSLWLISGDSTTVAAGAGTSGQTLLVGARPYSWVSQLANNLTKLGFNVDNESRFGSQNTNATSVTYDQYDAGTVRTNWINQSGSTFWSIGGGMFSSTVDTGTLAITTSLAFDIIDEYYVHASGNGSYAVNVDGGATLGTVNTGTAGGPNVLKQTVSGASVAVHTWNFVKSGTAATYRIGGVFRCSTRKGIHLIQNGMWGRLIADFNTTANSWSQQSMLATLAPTTHIIQLTINDIAGGTTVAAYQAALDAYVAASIAAGAETILMSGWRSAVASYPNFVNYQQYYNAIQAVAKNYGIAFIDMGNRMGSWEYLNPLGYMSDTVGHATQPAYADEAAWVSHILRTYLLGGQ